MENLAGKWLYFSWAPNPEINHFVHPDDLFDLSSQGIGLVYCLQDEGEYLHLQSRSIAFRGKRTGIKADLPPAPAFLYNQQVVIIHKPEKQAVIDYIFWHFKDEKYYYLLTIDGKANRKRYDVQDLKAKVT